MITNNGLGYNNSTLRQTPLQGGKPCGGRLQGKRSYLIGIILSVGFVYRTIKD